MTLTELRYIVAVARLKHFGRAAGSCHVSQPTLSVAIRKIEEELGVTMFERNRSQVLITPIGEKLVAQARRVLEEAEMMKALAQAEQDQLAAPLTLGVIYTLGSYLIPNLIPGLKAAAPAMHLLIRENFTEVLAQELKCGEIDVAVLSLPFDEPGIVSRALYIEPFVVAMPRDHPLTRREELEPDDLAGETILLLGARNCFRDQVLELCPWCVAPLSSDANEIQRTLEGSSIETIRQMTAAGAGITLLPSSATQPQSNLSQLLEIRPLKAPAPSRTVALAYRRGFPRPRAIAALVNAIRDALPSGVSPVEF